MGKRFKADGVLGKVAFYDIHDTLRANPDVGNEPLSNPYQYLDKIYFHSDLEYLQVREKVTRTGTFSAAYPSGPMNLVFEKLILSGVGVGGAIALAEVNYSRFVGMKVVQTAGESRRCLGAIVNPTTAVAELHSISIVCGTTLPAYYYNANVFIFW